MRNYLSFGGGVNSVAMYLYLKDQDIKFEAVFVDHGTDWPETYKYVEMFKKKYPLTILKPNVKRNEKIFNNLYKFCEYRNIIPMRYPRWCTKDFKITPITKYYKKPAFILLGFDFSEINRAKIRIEDGFEYRYPLIEAEMNRFDCKKYIQSKDLPVPPKSGCFICPFQSVSEWIRLRTEHPSLFCKAQKIENLYNKNRESRGLKPTYFSKGSLKAIVEEDQYKLFKQDEYPPCQCML